MVGPAYDLVTVMSKMLHLGMPIEQIVKAVTCTAAVALGTHVDLDTINHILSA